MNHRSSLLFSWILALMTATTVPMALADSSYSMLDNPQVLQQQQQQQQEASSGWQNTIPRVTSTQKGRLGLRGTGTSPSLSLETATLWDIQIPIIHSRDMKKIEEDKDPMDKPRMTTN